MGTEDDYGTVLPEARTLASITDAISNTEIPEPGYYRYGYECPFCGGGRENHYEDEEGVLIAFSNHLRWKHGW